MNLPPVDPEIRQYRIRGFLPLKARIARWLGLPALIADIRLARAAAHRGEIAAADAKAAATDAHDAADDAQDAADAAQKAATEANAAALEAISLCHDILTKLETLEQGQAVKLATAVQRIEALSKEAVDAATQVIATTRNAQQARPQGWDTDLEDSLTTLAGYIPPA